jgi:hypothetical protein
VQESNDMLFHFDRRPFWRRMGMRDWRPRTLRVSEVIF